MASGILGWILAWALFAFGGAYDWALIPTLIAIAALTVVKRPAIARGEWRGLDVALLVLLACALLQLVPMPRAVRDAISPGAAEFDARVALEGAARPAYATLSLVPEAWLRGAAMLIAAVLCFWLARDNGHGRAGRRLARAIAWMGLAAAMVTIVQPAIGTGIYGFWKLRSALARPAGPFISRNHMASWFVLALPLTAGCLAAHVRGHWTSRSKRVMVLADGRALWLLAAGLLMSAGLFMTQSRAGIVGFGAAIAFGLVATWRRMGVVGRTGVFLYVALLLIAAVAWSRPDLVLNRFDQALGENAWNGRPQIWRESIALLERFWPVGVGVGAFDVVMAAFQTSTHSSLINHAHNEALNFATEGGLLLSVPLALAVIVFVRHAARLLRHDHTPMRHIREGALAGLVGVATQSLWETPTLTPAVFLLLATTAGLAVHAPGRVREDDEA